MPATSKYVVEKQPAEVIKPSMDFTNQLDSGVTISSIEEVTSSPSGLTISGEAISGARVVMTISGGTHGYNYRVQVTITTSDSETLIGDGILKVRET